MALWLFSAGLFVCCSRRRIGHFFRAASGSWSRLSALSAAPILYWNSQNDWVTFRHVAVQAGVAEGKNRRAFAGSARANTRSASASLCSGSGSLSGSWRWCVYRPWAVIPGHRYLWWMSVPTFVVSQSRAFARERTAQLAGGTRTCPGASSSPDLWPTSCMHPGHDVGSFTAFVRGRPRGHNCNSRRP